MIQQFQFLESNPRTPNLYSEKTVFFMVAKYVLYKNEHFDHFSGTAYSQNAIQLLQQIPEPVDLSNEKFLILH